MNAVSGRRIAFVQYTNPASLPPLEHSSRILADAGWRVLFLGVVIPGVEAISFPAHPRIRVRLLPAYAPGWRQKVHYVRFCLWALLWVLWTRPRWVYASDLLSCPPALALCALAGIRTVYHEHDFPAPPANRFQRLCHGARRRLARRADLCVLPNHQRAKEFAAQTGARRTQAVWNCPAREEVGPERGLAAPQEFWLLYHGSIGPTRLPPTVLHALARLPDRVGLRVIGYETVGQAGYVARLRALARELGIERRVQFLGTLPLRRDLLAWCDRSDLGLALMPWHSDDPNARTMAGASNKPFDYLARGMTVLVTDLPDWRALYVETGCGLACDPDSADDLAAVIGRLVQQPGLARQMGEVGRRRIASEWNYESRFAPVYERLAAPGRSWGRRQ